MGRLEYGTDKTRLTNPPPLADVQSFALKALLKGHNAYVNSLAHIPHSSSGRKLLSRITLMFSSNRFGRKLFLDPAPLARYSPPRLGPLSHRSRS